MLPYFIWHLFHDSVVHKIINNILIQVRESGLYIMHTYMCILIYLICLLITWTLLITIHITKKLLVTNYTYNNILYWRSRTIHKNRPMGETVHLYCFDNYTDMFQRSRRKGWLAGVCELNVQFFLNGLYILSFML